jgi:hypothetical protein
VHVNASSISLGDVLAQRGTRDIDHPLSFDSRKLSTTEINYTTTKREGLAMVYALQNFHHYLLGGHFKMFTDHSTLKYLVNKPVLGGRICIWMLLFQEYDFEIIVNPRRMNKGPDHLLRLEHGEELTSLEDTLPDEKLLAIRKDDEHFTEIVQFLSIGMAPNEYTIPQKKQLVVQATDFSLLSRHLYKMGLDEILRRSVMEAERPLVLTKLMNASQEDIMQEKKLCRRFLELAFGDLPYIEMLKTIPKPAMYARGLGNHPEEIKFH